jgi:hypothetical protein
MTHDTTPTETPAADTLLEAVVSAQIAGDVAQVNDGRHALAAGLGAPLVETQLLIALAAATWAVANVDAEQAGRVAAVALRPIDGRPEVSAGLEAPLAAAATQLANALGGRPVADLEQPGLREAMDMAVRLSQRFLERFGPERG